MVLAYQRCPVNWPLERLLLLLILLVPVETIDWKSLVHEVTWLCADKDNDTRFNGRFPGQPGWAGAGMPPSEQGHPTFYRPDALTVVGQQCQSTEGK